MAFAVFKTAALARTFPHLTSTSKTPHDTIEPIPAPRPDVQHNPSSALNHHAPPVVLTEKSNAHVLHQIDAHILPLILGVYFLQFIDKTSISYASVFGLVADAHLQGQEFSWLSSCVYVAQLIFQPLVAWMLVRFRLGKFVALSAMGWGVCLASMAGAGGFRGLLVARVWLGIFEAGIAPGFVAMGSVWWRRREQPVRIAGWYSMNGVASVVGSLLCYGLAHVRPERLRAYQIIFLFFGCVTVVYSVFIWFFLPEDPKSARFLNEEDKLVAVERLKDNQQCVESREWRWGQVKESILDLKSYLWLAMMFAISTVGGGISTFNTLILKEFGYDSFHTILLNIPYGVFQIIAILLSAWFATKLRHKSPVLVLLTFPAIAGAILLVYIRRDSHHKGTLLFAYYLISFYVGITPLVYSWALANTAGQTKTKTTTAMLFIGQCSGNILGPQLYSTGDAPLYHRGLLSNLALLAALIGLVTLQVSYLKLLNKRQERRRGAEGKSAKVVDRSMLEIQDLGRSGEVASGDGASPGQLKDLTDFENSMFVYVY